MVEIEKEITQKQVIYEITKEELDAIKREERNKGRDDIAGYIAFSIKNFYLKMNFGGLCGFFSCLVDFINQDSSSIKNTYGYSFSDYMKKYR